VAFRLFQAFLLVQACTSHDKNFVGILMLPFAESLIGIEPTEIVENGGLWKGDSSEDPRSPLYKPAWAA
jgi:hypothetical protein